MTEISNNFSSAKAEKPAQDCKKWASSLSKITFLISDNQRFSSDLNSLENTEVKQLKPKLLWSSAGQRHNYSFSLQNNSLGKFLLILLGIWMCLGQVCCFGEQMHLQSNLLILYNQDNQYSYIPSNTYYNSSFKKVYEMQPICILGLENYHIPMLSSTSYNSWYLDRSTPSQFKLNVLHSSNMDLMTVKYLCFQNYHNNIYTNDIDINCVELNSRSGPRIYKYIRSIPSSQQISADLSQNILHYYIDDLCIQKIQTSYGFDYNTTLSLINTTRIQLEIRLTKPMRLYTTSIKFVIINLQKFPSNDKVIIHGSIEKQINSWPNKMEYNFQELTNQTFIIGFTSFKKRSYREIKIDIEQNQQTDTLSISYQGGYQWIKLHYIAFASTTTSVYKNPSSSNAQHTLETEYCIGLDEEFYCSLCEEGYNLTNIYVLRNPSKCIPALNNCLKLEIGDISQCKECRSEHVLLRNSSICAKTIENCSIISQENIEHCQECKQGYQLSEMNYLCYEEKVYSSVDLAAFIVTPILLGLCCLVNWCTLCGRRSLGSCISDFCPNCLPDCCHFRRYRYQVAEDPESMTNHLFYTE